MKHTIRILTFLLLLGAVALPGPAFAQSGNPDDATVFGGEYTLESGERVDDLTVLGGNVTLEEGSVVEGNITMFGGNLTVAGQVDDDVRIYGGNVDLADSALIDGDLRMVGGNVDRAGGSRVEGEVINGFDLPFSIDLPQIPGIDRPLFLPDRDSISRNAVNSVAKAIGLAVLAMVVILVAPSAASRAGEAAVRRPLEAGGIGLLVAVLTPILLVGFAISLIGIPVTILLAILAGLLLAFGWVALGVETGRRLAAEFKQDWQPVVQAGIGTFLLAIVAYAMELTPLIGWIVPILVGFVGMGGVLLSRFGTRVYPQAAA